MTLTLLSYHKLIKKTLSLKQLQKRPPAADDVDQPKNYQSLTLFSLVNVPQVTITKSFLAVINTLAESFSLDALRKELGQWK